MGCDIHAFVETKRKDDTSDRDWQFHCTYRFSRNYTLFALMAGVRRYSMYPNVKALEVALAKRGVAKLDDPKLSKEEAETILEEGCDSGLTAGQPSFKERGMPKNASYKTSEEYTYIVVEDENDHEERTCTKAQADSWVKNGSSEVWDFDRGGEPMRVTGPDWHSASWLDTEEVKQLAVRFRVALLDGIPDVKKQQAQGIIWAQDGLKKAKTANDAERIAFFEREVERETDWNRYNPLREHAYAAVEALAAMMDALDTHGLNARVVFWFDN